MSDRDALLSLQLIAATAGKLAEKVQRGQTWPGDLTEGLDRIQAALSDARREGASHAD